MAVINNGEIIAQIIKKNIASRIELSNFQSSSEIISHVNTLPLENIADNSLITKSISTNAQGANTKTYKIKRANASSKIQDHNQINKLNMSTMKWESELQSIELLKSGPHNPISKPKFR